MRTVVGDCRLFCQVCVTDQPKYELLNAQTWLNKSYNKFQLTFKHMELILELAVNPTVSGNDKKR